MKPCLTFLSIALSLLFCACGNKEEVPEEENPELVAMRERLNKKSSAEKEVEMVQKAIRAFHKDIGNLPKNIQQLKKLNYIDTIPVPEDGMVYYYDPQRGNYQYMPVQKQQQLQHMMNRSRY